MPSAEPIALIHWGDPTVEDEEIGEVKMLLEATLFGGDLAKQTACAPRIAPIRISCSRQEVLREELSTFISQHDNLQTLYFSCHGNSTGLSFDQAGTSTIGYWDFAAILTNALRAEDCVHVVFASCEAMAANPRIESLMPNAVYAVSGFTACPTSEDVAGLVASIIQDDVELFEELSATNAVACCSGISTSRIGSVVEKWKKILEKHTEDPTREVLGKGGLSVIQATRDIGEEIWRRKTILCT